MRRLKQQLKPSNPVNTPETEVNQPYPVSPQYQTPPSPLGIKNDYSERNVL